MVTFFVVDKDQVGCQEFFISRILEFGVFVRVFHRVLWILLGPIRAVWAVAGL